MKRLALMLATLLLPPVAATAQEPDEPPVRTGADDATVVAVIDSGISPYHWDYLASRMPQATDEDPTNDLPLDAAPHTWLPGFPDPSAFASYNRFDLTLDEVNAGRSITALDSQDSAKWNAVRQSTATAGHYYWFPQTKIIGGMTFASGGRIRAAASTHGMGTASVSVGNIFGTCAECLLVFIQYGSVADGERAIEWALRQPWIDLISNSYGFSLVERDRLYSGSDTALQRQASLRGQTVLFSAGNGISNTFTIPNSTLFSSQEGPDWIVTVGGVNPNTGGSYTGHGKPADISGLGSAYPSSYGAGTVGNAGSNFSGTSNATPQVAGMYAKALFAARRSLPGPSRAQADGVIAVQDPDERLEERPFACAAARPSCELADGILTAKELRTRFFHGATHTPAGMEVGQTSGLVGTPAIGEDEFLNEGHGTYYGKKNGAAAFAQEMERIVAPMQGRAQTLQRPAGEREWMIVDSYCRQEIWGDWTDGYFVRGQTELPGATPPGPLRLALQASCPALFPPV
ncbi:MAG TPA: S8/S53 family peptidase [Actinomycetota bacterium]|nr:S8/S53 family peptidase [Actinomycetota bacterium]